MSQWTIELLKHTTSTDEEIIKSLKLCTTKQLNDNLHYIFRLACRVGRTNIVKFMLENPQDDIQKAQIIANNNEPICKASENGHAEIVEILLTYSNVDPTVCDNYPIRKASAKLHVKVVEILLKSGRIDPSALHWYSFRHGCLIGFDDDDDISDEIEQVKFEMAKLYYKYCKLPMSCIMSVIKNGACRYQYDHILNSAKYYMKIPTLIWDNHSLAYLCYVLCGEGDYVETQIEFGKILLRDSRINMAKILLSKCPEMMIYNVGNSLERMLKFDNLKLRKFMMRDPWMFWLLSTEERRMRWYVERSRKWQSLRFEIATFEKSMNNLHY